jgi:hypothetical protein
MSDHQGEPQVVTARKNHKCHWCGDLIQKGSRYETWFIAYEGSAWRCKMHPECSEGNRCHDYDGDDLCLVGQFQRGHSHECGDCTTEQGVMIECPGCIKEQAESKNGPPQEENSERSGEIKENCGIPE